MALLPFLLANFYWLWHPFHMPIMWSYWIIIVPWMEMQCVRDESDSVVNRNLSQILIDVICSQRAWPEHAAVKVVQPRWRGVIDRFVSAEAKSRFVDYVEVKSKVDNIRVIGRWITVKSIVQCCVYTHKHTHLVKELGKQDQQITLSPHGSMTGRVVHFRLSTTYQGQNMSVWWSCTFHLIIFSHTHSSQRLFMLCKISYARKRLQCSGAHKWSSTRPISVIDSARPGDIGMHVCSPRWCQIRHYAA